MDALGGPDWLRATRHAALDRFAGTPLPTDAAEIWRYSRIDELDLERYRPLTTGPPGPDSSAMPEPLRVALGQAGAMIVVSNGKVVAADIDEPGVQLQSVEDGPWSLGALAGEPDALVSLNAAFASAPLHLRVAKGSVVTRPLVILNLLDVADAAVFPRLGVRLEPGAEATVIEVHLSGALPALSVPVTELEVGDAAHLGYLNLQLLGEAVWQIGLQASTVGRDASLISASIAFGGDYARVRTDSALTGRGASSRLLAGYFGSGSQTHDFRTLQDHRAGKTTSDLLFKGAVGGHARSVYSGLIKVDKGAAGASAFQANRNLVLSDGAHADSVPNLEIEENDVRCTHASAVGPIDEEQRFYLESRGVPPEVADRLIVLGFLDEVLVQVPYPALLGFLRSTLADRFTRSEVEGS